MDPYQAWRRHLISTTTYLDDINKKNIKVTERAVSPIVPSLFDLTISSDMTISGALTVATTGNGVFVTSGCSLIIEDGGSLTIS